MKTCKTRRQKDKIVRNKYNIPVHINIYNENKACVSHMQQIVREEMRDQSLLLAASNGLMLLDQEATRGKLIKVLYSTEFQHLYKF